ncbi:MAG TPA: radical SAM protein, partial [Synergistetes bacterium]|nr:radical SAM protein [Synergistota bacterium]
MRKKIKETPTISLYLHFPFCESKCPYCAFYSIRPGKRDMEEYLSSLVLEIDLLEKEMEGFPPVKTIYIGGGTPTLASSAIWGNLVGILENRFNFLPGAEATVEANPGSMTQEQIKIWKDWRISRV